MLSDQLNGRIEAATNFTTVKSKSPVFGPVGVLLLYLSFHLVLFAIIIAQRALLGRSAFSHYWYYDSSLASLLVVLVILSRRPHILSLSRWRPRWTDVTFGASLGVLSAALPLFFAANIDRYIGPSAFPQSSLLYVVLIGPVLEEIVFRGTFLRSFETYWPRWAAVLAVALLAAFAHSDYGIALLGQLVLSVVYVSLGDSIVGSIIAHVCSNAFVYLPAAAFFQKWHIFTIWK
jgi:membrane protease YdiL (CAAX protease family)